MKNQKARMMTLTALFAAIATIVMFFEFPLPFMPPFLKVDLSGAVILIGAFLFGIPSALTMALIKDVIHLMSSQTGGSGELADFLMTATMVILAVSFYKRHKSKKGAVIGCTAGTVGMAIMGILTNNFIIIPFYATIMPIDQILSDGMAVYLFGGVLPFNLIKGGILSVLTILLYKRLANFIRTEHSKCEQPLKN